MPGITGGDFGSYRLKTPGGEEGLKGPGRAGGGEDPRRAKGQERNWPAEGGIPRGVAKDRRDGLKTLKPYKRQEGRSRRVTCGGCPGGGNR